MLAVESAAVKAVAAACRGRWDGWAEDAMQEAWVGVMEALHAGVRDPAALRRAARARVWGARRALRRIAAHEVPVAWFVGEGAWGDERES